MPGGAEQPDDAVLEQSLARLEELGKARGGRATRHDARSLLVALGRLAADGAPLDLPALRARLERAAAGVAPSWEAAVEEELRLAAAEYVTSVDERYLGLPDYDFDYTTSARERLDARLRACALLDLDVPRGLVERVEAADAVYAGWLERRAGNA